MDGSGWEDRRPYDLFIKASTPDGILHRLLSCITISRRRSPCFWTPVLLRLFPVPLNAPSATLKTLKTLCFWFLQLLSTQLQFFQTFEETLLFISLTLFDQSRSFSVGYANFLRVM